MLLCETAVMCSRLSLSYAVEVWVVGMRNCHLLSFPATELVNVMLYEKHTTKKKYLVMGRCILSLGNKGNKCVKEM